MGTGHEKAAGWEWLPLPAALPKLSDRGVSVDCRNRHVSLSLDTLGRRGCTRPESAVFRMLGPGSNTNPSSSSCDNRTRDLQRGGLNGPGSNQLSVSVFHHVLVPVVKLASYSAVTRFGDRNCAMRSPSFGPLSLAVDYPRRSSRKVQSIVPPWNIGRGMVSFDVAAHFYTLQQAAAYLGLERHTLARWVRQGRLQAQKVGGVVLIERAAIDAIAATRKGAA